MKAFLHALKYMKSMDEHIFRLFLPSLAGIVVCMACLAGATWAWFTAGVIAPVQTVTAATYDVAVSVDDRSVTPESGKYTLSQGSHTVTLKAIGNASTGYCKILFNVNTDHPYYTPQFPNPKDQHSGQEFTFKISVPNATEMIVIPTWGTYAGEEVLGGYLDLTVSQSGGQNHSTGNTPLLENAAPDAADTGSRTYTIKEGDSLWEIAKDYDGISAEDIAAYNSIEDPRALQIGQVLHIPFAEDLAAEKSAGDGL